MPNSMIRVSALRLVLVTLAFARSNGLQTFEGEVADTQCAMNVHSLTRSHAEMLKSKSLGTDPASCAHYCVRYMGGDFVLVMKGDVYRFDNSAMAEKFAGRKVKLTGKMDPKTNVIHIVSIEEHPQH